MKSFFSWIFAVTAISFNFSGLAQEAPVVLEGGTIITMAGERWESASLIMHKGKIVSVGENLPIPPGATVVDVRGKTVIPGLIDCMTNHGIVYLNEFSEQITPQLKAIDDFDPYGEYGVGVPPGSIRIHSALSGGITTQYIGPADRAVIGGMGAVVKTAGDSFDEIVMKELAAMDITLGSPPVEQALKNNKAPFTRMGEVALIRQALIKAQEYLIDKNRKPQISRQPDMEALGMLLRREIPARIQANASADIRSAIRLAEEFDFKLILDGAASADIYYEQLARENIPVVLGPVSHPYISHSEIPVMDEYALIDEGLAGRLLERGVKFAFGSFSRKPYAMAPDSTGKWLLIDAAIASGYGMNEMQVLQALTIRAAEILGIDRRVGSLEVGKDADVVVLNGPPLSIRTWAEQVYINGKLVHHRRED